MAKSKLRFGKSQYYAPKGRFNPARATLQLYVEFADEEDLLRAAKYTGVTIDQLKLLSNTTPVGMIPYQRYEKVLKAIDFFKAINK